MRVNRAAEQAFRSERSASTRPVPPLGVEPVSLSVCTDWWTVGRCNGQGPVPMYRVPGGFLVSYRGSSLRSMPAPIESVAALEPVDIHRHVLLILECPLRRDSLHLVARTGLTERSEHSGFQPLSLLGTADCLWQESACPNLHTRTSIVAPVLVHQRFDTVSGVETVRTQGVTDLTAWDCSCAIVAEPSYAAWGVSTHPTKTRVVAPVLVHQRFVSSDSIEIRLNISMSAGQGPRESRVGPEQQRHAQQLPGQSRCHDRVTIGRKAAMAGAYSERAQAPGGGRDSSKMQTSESFINTVSLYNIKAHSIGLCAPWLGLGCGFDGLDYDCDFELDCNFGLDLLSICKALGCEEVPGATAARRTC